MTISPQMVLEKTEKTEQWSNEHYGTVETLGTGVV